MSVVAYEKTAGCAVLRIDYPPVNVLSHGVRSGLVEGLARAQADDGVAAVVLLCAGRTFIAGADITEFGTTALAIQPNIWEMIEALEASSKPVVAAIHGTALGGGLETALACHGRVAVASARLGLPEVRLGILAGGGGTQRVSRLAGPEFAIDFMTTGESIDAAQALQVGLIDAIVEDLEAGAITHALALAKGPLPMPVLQRQDRGGDVDAAYFEAARHEAVARSRGAIAPLAIIDCVEAACTLSGMEGLAYEQQRVLELMAGPQHAALRYYFFAEREARKIPGIAESEEHIGSVAVVGAGVLGCGIAMACADAGLSVRLVDGDQAALDRGMGAIALHYDEACGRITGQIDYAGLEAVDLAIEAGDEDMARKQRLLADLDRATGPGTLLATSTSFLDIDEMARATSRPDRVLGMHFFAPAKGGRLLENVRGALTSPESIGQAMAIGRQLGKVTVLATNADGFIGHHMMRSYAEMTDFLLAKGVTPAQIDQVATDFGMLTGPCAGRSSAEIAQARERGETAGPFSDEEIRDYLFLPLVNEGARLLENGTALRASDIDVLWVNGYGFPAHKGGPMWWGQTVGLQRVVDLAVGLGEEIGSQWAPAPLLLDRGRSSEGW